MQATSLIVWLKDGVAESLFEKKFLILPQCDFLVISVLHMATTMGNLCRIHRQLIFNICTDSRTFTRIFNKTRVNYKIFFILMQKLESTSFHIKI